MKTRDAKSLTNEKIMRTLSEHGSILKKYKVRKIGLFGSFARGKQKKNSDIDFLVELEDSNFDNFMELVFYLEHLFGRKVELITNGNLSPYIIPYVEKEVKWYEAQ